MRACCIREDAACAPGSPARRAPHIPTLVRAVLTGPMPVPAAVPKPTPSAQALHTARPAGKPVKALQQKRWMLENHVACEPIVLGPEELSRDKTVYIAACRECVVQVRGRASRRRPR